MKTFCLRRQGSSLLKVPVLLGLFNYSCIHFLMYIFHSAMFPALKVCLQWYTSKLF